jgi:hypothetical protein
VLFARPPRLSESDGGQACPVAPADGTGMTSWFKKKRAKAKRKPDPHLIIFSSRGVMQRSQNMGKEREMKNETMAKT